MIGLFIAAILLAFSFRFFSEISLMEKKMYSASEKILSKNSLNIKLDTIFSEVSDIGLFKKSFYTKDGSLNFIFDSGIDPDPLFSSFLSGLLYLKDNNLILETTSAELQLDSSKPKKIKNNKIRKEVLFKNVKELSFEFLEKTQTPGKANYLTSSTWEKKDYLPSILKIKLKTKEEDMGFTFFLLNENYITYE